MKRALVLALLLVGGVAHADSFDPRVMVMPVEGEAPRGLGKLARDVADALAKGAKDTEANVARADATLADTAGIVGCEPTARECVDAVAAALNVDQMLIAKLEIYGDDALVEVTAVTRETEPLVQTFPVRKATRRADLKTIRDAVRGMLEEGEVRRAAQAGAVDPPDEPVDPLPDETPTETPVVETTTRRTDVDRRSPIPKYVVIGGGVLAAIGVTCWALAAGTQGDIDDAPTATADDLDALARLEDRAALRANLGNAFVVIGAVAASAGAVWWLRDRAQHKAAVTVTAVPGGGAGVSIGGAW